MYAYYRQNGRQLPWRYETDPYKILVSEVMLQQTQVGRVIPKYREFLKQFPTGGALASAPLQSVLAVWQGLGYNRRAKYLKDAMGIILRDPHYAFVRNFKKQISNSKNNKSSERQNTDSADVSHVENMTNLLDKLPGVGHATACAIVTYAFNLPTLFIETNIRAVFLYFFFKEKEHISDTELMFYVKKTMDYRSPRDWYYALTDFGAMLKTKEKFSNTQSKQYTRQLQFQGSLRQVRGAIVRSCITSGRVGIEEMSTETGFDRSRIRLAVEGLVRDGLLVREGMAYRLA